MAISRRMLWSSSTIRIVRFITACRAAPRRCCRGSPEGGDHARVELRPGAAVDLLARGREGGGRPVRAVGGQRVERVGDREHARGERDRVAREAVRVARAVPALVVVADDELALAEEVDVAQDLRADHGVAAHQRVLLLGQRAGLEQDRVGHGDLADVVQQEAELDLRRVLDRRSPQERASSIP